MPIVRSRKAVTLLLPCPAATWPGRAPAPRPILRFPFNKLRILFVCWPDVLSFVFGIRREWWRWPCMLQTRRNPHTRLFVRHTSILEHPHHIVEPVQGSRSAWPVAMQGGTMSAKGNVLPFFGESQTVASCIVLRPRVGPVLKKKLNHVDVPLEDREHERREPPLHTRAQGLLKLPRTCPGHGGPSSACRPPPRR